MTRNLNWWIFYDFMLKKKCSNSIHVFNDRYFETILHSCTAWHKIQQLYKNVYRWCEKLIERGRKMYYPFLDFFRFIPITCNLHIKYCIRRSSKFSWEGDRGLFLAIFLSELIKFEFSRRADPDPISRSAHV